MAAQKLSALGNPLSQTQHCTAYVRTARIVRKWVPSFTTRELFYLGIQLSRVIMWPKSLLFTPYATSLVKQPLNSKHHFSRILNTRRIQEPYFCWLSGQRRRRRGRECVDDLRNARNSKVRGANKSMGRTFLLNGPINKSAASKNWNRGEISALINGELCMPLQFPLNGRFGGGGEGMRWNVLNVSKAQKIMAWWSLSLFSWS